MLAAPSRTATSAGAPRVQQPGSSGASAPPLLLPGGLPGGVSRLRPARALGRPVAALIHATPGCRLPLLAAGPRCLLPTAARGPQARGRRTRAAARGCRELRGLRLLHGHGRELELGRLVARVDALLPLPAVLLLLLDEGGQGLGLLRELRGEDLLLGVDLHDLLHELHDLLGRLLAEEPWVELLPEVPAVVEEEVALVDAYALRVLHILLEGRLQAVELEAQGQQGPVLEGEAAEEGLAAADVAHVLHGEDVHVRGPHLLVLHLVLLLLALGSRLGLLLRRLLPLGLGEVPLLGLPLLHGLRELRDLLLEPLPRLQVLDARGDLLL
mmetsp:Transcript_74008/g.229559  ORF Transcript_74008/g.229559 Transcript_74008/m.229559 type:complete len:327 (+) Transcript_74008:594-1574(+)